MVESKIKRLINYFVKLFLCVCSQLLQEPPPLVRFVFLTHRPLRINVQFARSLIQNDDLRVSNQSSDHGDTLLLSLWQFASTLAYICKKKILVSRHVSTFKMCSVSWRFFVFVSIKTDSVLYRYHICSPFLRWSHERRSSSQLLPPSQ